MIVQHLSNLEQFSQFPNDVKAAVLRMNGGDPIHHATLDDVLYKSVGAEAVAHGIEINDKNFENVLRAIDAQKVQAYFLMVSWENCRRKVAGGGTEFTTVITEWDGVGFKHYPATHGEDSYVSPEPSQEFRKRTISSEYPKGMGLGTFFMYERVRLAVMNELGSTPFGMVSRGRVAEYSAHSVPMIRLLTSLGATLGQENQGTILQLDGFPPDLMDKKRVPVLTEALGRSEGDILSNVFVTSWTGNRGERIAASFTEAISTFSGQPIVRVQFTSNGQLPNSKTLKNALASLIMAGRAEIMARKHLSDTNAWDLDDARMVLRIHALNEPEIGVALKEIGAKPRMIGTHPMLPVITNFKNTPDNVLGFSIPIAKPFVTTPLVQVMEQRPRQKLGAGATVAAVSAG